MPALALTSMASFTYFNVTHCVSILRRKSVAMLWVCFSAVIHYVNQVRGSSSSWFLIWGIKIKSSVLKTEPNRLEHSFPVFPNCLNMLPETIAQFLKTLNTKLIKVKHLVETFSSKMKHCTQIHVLSSQNGFFPLKQYMHSYHTSFSYRASVKLWCKSFKTVRIDHVLNKHKLWIKQVDLFICLFWKSYITVITEESCVPVLIS